MRQFKLSLIAASLAFSGSVLAATDGSLGLTSVGESVVTIIKDNAVQITNVNDIDLGQHATLAADLAVGDDVCVFSSTSGYNVTITATGNTFALDSGSDTIPFTLEWNGAAVTHGTQMTGLTGDNVSLNCGASTNANFEVTVLAADFNAAPPGTYTNTLSLTVAPE